MEGSGVEIDVSSVGLTMKAFHTGSQIVQEVWSDARERAVRAVDNQSHPLEVEIPGKALSKMPRVELALGGDCVQKEWPGWVGNRESWGAGLRAGHDPNFELLLHGIVQLQSGRRKNLYAVVLVRIVGCTDHDSGLCPFARRKKRNRRSGDHAAHLGHAAGVENGAIQHGLEPGSRDARIARDQDAWATIEISQVFRETKPDAVHRVAVQRGISGYSANSIRPEEWLHR
jgi:hypothetical protein